MPSTMIEGTYRRTRCTLTLHRPPLHRPPQGPRQVPGTPVWSSPASDQVVAAADVTDAIVTASRSSCPRGDAGAAKPRHRQPGPSRLPSAVPHFCGQPGYGRRPGEAWRPGGGGGGSLFFFLFLVVFGAGPSAASPVLVLCIFACSSPRALLVRCRREPPVSVCGCSPAPAPPTVRQVLPAVAPRSSPAAVMLTAGGLVALSRRDRADRGPPARVVECVASARWPRFAADAASAKIGRGRRAAQKPGQRPSMRRLWRAPARRARLSPVTEPPARRPLGSPVDTFLLALLASVTLAALFPATEPAADVRDVATKGRHRALLFLASILRRRSAVADRGPHAEHGGCICWCGLDVRVSHHADWARAPGARRC